MKKVLSAALTTALGLAATSPAFATETRINGLSASSTFDSNGIFNEKSITIRDSANILFLPQYLPTYKNSVDVDATQGATYGGMNVRYALSDDAVLMLFGRRSKWAPVTGLKSINGSDAAAAAGFGAHAGLEPTNHQFGVGFGMKAGESLRLGTTLSIGGARNDGGGATEVAPISQNSNTLVDFNAGLGLDLNETNSLDFGLNVRFGDFTNVETRQVSQSSYVPDGLFGIGIIGKGEFQVHQIAKLVPYFRFGYDSRGVSHFGRSDDPCPPQGGTCDTPKVGHLKSPTLNLGTDLAISPVEGVLIQPGLGLAYRGTSLSGNSAAATPAGSPSERDIEITRQWMPWYGFAAEAKAFEWLVLRLGARQTIVRKDQDNTEPAGPPNTPQKSNETHTSNVTNTVSTGMGIKLMGWQLDLNVNPQFFNNGLYAATGNATSPFALDFALGYDW